ncbi:MAG TPA: bifunctional biotin--[acetyl-CoA-carboxylase] ligase/biotin operon repressor BirA [Spongiibacteraceae bacterium]|jgi:BirA family biotin operon repressor/biotin-[acetyl-CoA-carboxylase] ligase|nr:bifunctional biotin--[acetyl-CoA-carboxylase] ligase/biotin operon repressor BirA [Spongiibacteraceae bacterium]
MREQLITLLSSGAFCSGEVLGRKLGVTRAAIWKQLKQLERLGLHIEVVRGKGYRLRDVPSLLDRERVLSAMPVDAGDLLQALELFEDIPSTNGYLLELASRRRIHGMAASAERQSQGRGRRGRVWQSPYGSNLYLSVGWTFQGGAAALEGLSLAVGVAVVGALRSLGCANVGLKWPNDILWNDQKLAGILLELVGDADNACHVVVGLGLNVAMPSVDAAAIDQPWTDLRHILGVAPDRSLLLGRVLGAILMALREFAVRGFSGFRAEWLGLDALADREVMLQVGNESILGVARGVNMQGELVLDTPGGQRHFHGGELSVRAVG